MITGIYGYHLIRLNEFNTIICYIAAFTVITASLIALYQDSLKRRLAFSTIGQLAYIIMGVGLASKFGFLGGTLHIVMHAFGKITLFFCAGAIYVATKEKYFTNGWYRKTDALYYDSILYWRVKCNWSSTNRWLH